MEFSIVAVFGIVEEAYNAFIGLVAFNHAVEITGNYQFRNRSLLNIYIGYSIITLY